jgi:hypothetical protein
MVCCHPVRLTGRHLIVIVFAFLLVTFCLTPTAFGQTATATLSGTVADANGGLISGASITLLNSATSLKRQTTTNGEGSFTFPLLPPGTYTLTTQHEGFTTTKIPDLTLNVGDRKALQIQLQTGDVNATVQVTNEPPLINESPAVGTVVDRQFVENMPLNGRSLQSLITLTPGVTVVPNASTNVRGELSVNGQRAESNYYTVDGVGANTGTIPGNVVVFGGSGNLPGETALGTTQSLVSLDALQEFRIQTSTYSAEYGRTPGAQISFVTRSGTNDWHGTAFDFVRNVIFDANNWFNNANRLPKSKTRQNDFGATLSGPILLPRFGEGGHQPWYNGHNRTFFFFSYEGLRLSTPQPAATTFVPTVALRQTAPAALKPLLNAYPLPNGPDNGATGAAQFTSAFSTPGTLDATSIRIDHTFNTKFSIFGRFSYSPSQALRRVVTLPLSNPSTVATLVKTLTIGMTNTVSSRLANEFRGNVTWNSGRGRMYLDDLGGAIPFTLDEVKDGNGQPTPGVDELQFLISFGGTRPLDLFDKTFAQRQLNFVDTLSYAIGSHSLKIGADFRQLNTPIHVASVLEAAVFTTATQVQQNLVASGSFAQSQASFPIGPVYKNLSLFVDDAWRPTSRLSLSLGLRWELNPPPTDAYGNPPYTLDQITDLTTAKLAPKGTPLWETTYRNFAPRLGLAYKLRQSSERETVVRGGFGVFYDLGNTFASSGYGGVGIGGRSNFANVPFPFTAAQLNIPPPSVTPPYNGSVTAFDPHLQLPYTLQWNAAIEQALGQRQALNVSYIGAAGRRLLLVRQFFPASKGNPNFMSGGSLTVTSNGATSDYDALQVQFQRRLSKGLQAQASYTWSHSIDEASLNSVVFELLRASSDFDVRHNFQAAITYDMPGRYDNPLAGAILRHWAIDARVTARSALPFEVSSGVIFDVSGTRQQLRANLVPGQPLYIKDTTAPGGRKVNFNAFTAPTAAEQAAFQFGNAPRNLLRGFPAWQVDFAVRREFPLYERLKLQFRAEAFNVFNHPIFGAIQNTLTTGPTQFGRATGSLNNQLGGLNALYQQGGPRSLQFALKVIF